MFSRAGLHGNGQDGFWGMGSQRILEEFFRAPPRFEHEASTKPLFAFAKLL
jgi:hypothetical protein